MSFKKLHLPLKSNRGQVLQCNIHNSFNLVGFKKQLCKLARKTCFSSLAGSRGQQCVVRQLIDFRQHLSQAAARSTHHRPAFFSGGCARNSMGSGLARDPMVRSCISAPLATHQPASRTHFKPFALMHQKRLKPG